jgi:hypothetical protein
MPEEAEANCVFVVQLQVFRGGPRPMQHPNEVLLDVALRAVASATLASSVYQRTPIHTGTDFGGKVNPARRAETCVMAPSFPSDPF